MPSPAKKRKLNGESGAKPRGLEYFFSKQKQNGGSQNDPSIEEVTHQKNEGAESSSPADSAVPISDEELARKLQAEWDEEDRRRRPSLLVSPAPGGEAEQPRVKSASPAKEATGAEETTAPQSQEDAAPAPRTLPWSKNTLSLQSVTTTEDQVTATIPLDESPLAFRPKNYLSQLQRQWAAEMGGDGQASYSLLTRCFVLVNGTQSRIKIVDTLVNCLRLLIEGDPDSLLPAVWLATNAIGPPYESLELGLGGAAISKALKQVCGLDGRGLKELFNKHGDPGDVAYEAKKKQAFTLRRPKPLTIRGVYQALLKVAQSQGPGSVEAKQRLVDRLLQDARGGEESRYIVRTLCQHLRIGAVKTTMLIALSRAFLLSRPASATFTTHSAASLAVLKKDELADVYGRAEETVKACFARRPNYNDLVPVLLEIGVAGPEASQELLLRCGLTVHIPLRPMLGSITRDLGEMLGKLQDREFACEYKYDGQRAQVHCDAAGKVSIFSRHLERMTDKYPDLVALVPQLRGDGVESFVLEGEVVAVDQETGALRSFQTLTGRARKGVALGNITIDVCLFAFDLMFLNGQPLLDRPFRERRGLLRSLFVQVPRRFTWVESMDATSADGEAISAFFKSATDNKCEGIMVKILDNLPELVYAGDEMDGEGEEEREPVRKAPEKIQKKGTQMKGEEGGGDTEKKKPGRRKPLLATYEPDKRLDSWLKVKKDYGATFDTLDLIPIAGWHGMGRKAKWWSPILMAVRNEETGSLEAVTKCISGFTDAFYKANRAFYDNGKDGDDSEDEEEDEDNSDLDGKEAEENEDEDANETSKHKTEKTQKTQKSRNTRAQKPSYVDYNGPEPDVWFEPQEVWEMAFADITLSPTYTAAIGLVSDVRGLSLRFPRFLRKRDDKGLDEASTSAFLAELYRKQEARAVASNEKDKEMEAKKDRSDNDDDNEG